MTDLIDRWCELRELGVYTIDSAAVRLGVDRDTLRTALRRAHKRGDPNMTTRAMSGEPVMTPAMVARCLLLHADDLEVADHLDLAEKMRRRARLIAQGVKDA